MMAEVKYAIHLDHIRTGRDTAPKVSADPAGSSSGRIWRRDRPPVMFVGLDRSTSDETARRRLEELETRARR